MVSARVESNGTRVLHFAVSIRRADASRRSSAAVLRETVVDSLNYNGGRISTVAICHAEGCARVQGESLTNRVALPRLSRRQPVQHYAIRRVPHGENDRSRIGNAAPHDFRPYHSFRVRAQCGFHSKSGSFGRWWRSVARAGIGLRSLAVL